MYMSHLWGLKKDLHASFNSNLNHAAMLFKIIGDTIFFVAV